MNNPANPSYQLVGVYNSRNAFMFYELQQNGQSICQSFIVWWLWWDISNQRYESDHCTTEKVFPTPEQVKKNGSAPRRYLRGQYTRRKHQRFCKDYKGEGSCNRNVVLRCRTSFRMCTSINYEDAYAKAVESLESGKAYQSLQNLIALQ